MIKRLSEFRCFVTLIGGELHTCRMVEDGGPECLSGLLVWNRVAAPADEEFLKAVNLALGLRLTQSDLTKREAARPILVVEESIRSLLRESIEIFGYSVLTAENGCRALDTIERCGPPSLVLLDLIMPEMDGFEFLRQIRQHSSQEISKVPVVVTTARASLVSQLREFANEVLLKPIDLDVLAWTVGRYCR